MRPEKQRLREIGFKKGHKYFNPYSDESNDANRCSLKFSKYVRWCPPMKTTPWRRLSQRRPKYRRPNYGQPSYIYHENDKFYGPFINLILRWPGNQ